MAPTTLTVVIFFGLGHLEGDVDSRRTRRIIEDVVEAVVGVVEVNNEIRIASKVYLKLKREHAEKTLDHHH